MPVNLNITNPTIGQQILLHSKPHIVGLPLPDGRLTLTNVTDRTPLIITQQEMAQKYLEGHVELVDDSVTSTFTAKRKLRSLDLTIATDEDKKSARRKQLYVEALEKLEIKTYRPSQFTEVIESVSAEIGDEKKPTHWTVQRWRKDWHKSAGDPRVFLPQRARHNNRKLRWDPELVVLASRVALDGLMTPQQHSVRKFFTALEVAVSEANKLREPEHQIKMPSEGSVRRYCDRIDTFKMLASRTSKSHANRVTRQYGKGVKTVRILERVEIDHTLLDLFVIDTATKILLGRPWLTIVLDAHSRAILGFYLGFEPPSWVSVMEALKRAILPKADLKKKYPEIKNPWDCCGVMENAIVDNGKEFHSLNFEDGAWTLRINIQYCPPHQPWFKGKVERFMRTVNQGVIHLLPGSTFGKQYRMADYDPVKHATVDFHDLVKILHMWIVDIYMQSYHTGIKTTPATKWAESAMENPPRLVPSRRDLDITLGVVDERSLHHYGIEMQGQFFNCQELSIVRARLENPETGKRKQMARVKIKLLPDDISGIYVRDPLTDSYVWVPNTDQEYAAGKGWHQHKIIQKYAKATGKGKVDQEALRIAEAKIARAIKKAVKDGGGKRGNKKVARYENFGQEDYQNCPDAVAERASPTEPVDDTADDSADENFVEPSFIPTSLPAAGEDWEVHTT